MGENRGRKSPAAWPSYVAAGVLILILGAGWKAREDTKARHAQAALDQKLSRMEGHPTCRLTVLKAREEGKIGDRVMTIYKPQELPSLTNPVVECQMVDGKGRPAAPLRVEVHCERRDLKCIRIIDTQG